MKAIKLLCLTALAASFTLATSCTKEEPQASAQQARATEGLSVLEKAKIARIARKKATEEKRKALNEKYTAHDVGAYKAHVSFEDEMVESDNLNLWVPKNFIAVLGNKMVYDDESTSLQKVTLINQSKMYSATADLSYDFGNIDLSKPTFCKDIVVKKTAYSNVNVLIEPYVLVGDKSSVCHLTYQDIAINKYVSEYTEVFADGTVTFIKTSSSQRLNSKNILKKAFNKAVSEKLQTSVRHALGEFLDTEKYTLKKI